MTDRLRELAEQQEHPWGLASVKRCDALVRLAAATYDEHAAAALAQAADDYERARPALRRGAVAAEPRPGAAPAEEVGRRARLARARCGRVRRAGLAGLGRGARSELGRIGARRPAPRGELTPTERRVVELAAEGLANKEIAQALVVAVHTVEVHLSHAYAKLGVRSRSQLARAVSARRSAVKDSGFP